MAAAARPPSVDRLARHIAEHVDLPHPLRVDIARQAVAAGPGSWGDDDVVRVAQQLQRSLIGPVINATGVLLHTNLGRATMPFTHPAQALNIEFDLATGQRGTRHGSLGTVLASLCGAEAALVVNNNAAAVLLVLAALTARREVAVSRGESVEIGGSFRVPEVMAQSGSRLVDVGTTNRTRRADYAAAIQRDGADVAAVLKVHPSNYRVTGFIEDTPIHELATLGVPLIADIGSGLIDRNCPWLSGPPPAWLAGEPAAKQAIADGADIVTFSGDKLFGGPQAGIIVGRADLIVRCAQHPLARALRPGAHVAVAVQNVALSYLAKTVVDDVAFWRHATASVESLSARATHIAGAANSRRVRVVGTDAVPGAGSAPGVTIPSAGLAVDGDHLAALRACTPPIVARAKDGTTVLDLRAVDPADDAMLAASLAGLVSSP